MKNLEHTELIAISIAVIFHVATAMVCPATYTEESGFCFRFTPGLTLPWSDARDACKQDGGHLVVEVTPEEHTAFVKYRQSLAQRGDPLWIGLHVAKQGTWSFLSDRDFANRSGPIYQNWKGGSLHQANAGQCAAALEENSDLLWQSMDCTLPLSFVCEIASTTPSGGGGGGGGSSGTTTVSTSTPATTTSPVQNMTTTFGDRECRQWQKVFPSSRYTLSAYIFTNSTLSSLHTLTHCAILCSHTPGCSAFNHRHVDNKCEFIMTHVNGIYVTAQTGWDVWMELGI